MKKCRHLTLGNTGKRNPMQTRVLITLLITNLHLALKNIGLFFINCVACLLYLNCDFGLRRSSYLCSRELCLHFIKVICGKLMVKTALSDMFLMEDNLNGCPTMVALGELSV